MNQSKQLPQGVPWTDAKGMVDYRWVAILNSLKGNLPPSGVGWVINGSQASYGEMTLFQGVDAARPSGPSDGWLYFALDTGRVYHSQAGAWATTNAPLFGDVTKPANSDITTLASVFASPGTYGDASLTPILTIDAKGRVTDLSFESVIPLPAPPGGLNTQLLWNNAGVESGTSGISFNPTTQSLTFANPNPTFQSLSPLTTKGDLLGRTSTASVRLPVGTNGQVLLADSTTSTGLAWGSTRTIDIEFQWNVISVFPLIEVPANVLVKSITTYIEVPFDGTGASLTIGDSSDTASLQTNIDPYEEAGYQSTPASKYGSLTQVNLYLTPGSATQGNGLISIELQER